MKRRYKVVLNVELEDPEARFPAGGDYTHLNRIQGLVSHMLNQLYWPGLKATVTLDKIVDKGEVK